MSSDGHSSYASEKSSLALLNNATTTGTTRVKYNAESDWDFLLDGTNTPVDLALVLPHYRARHQPIDHRMSMFVGSEASEPIKLKVCRTISRSRFYLEVQASSADVTVWLPSDFKGQIHHTGKASFSAGFVNRVLRNVRMNEGSGAPRHQGEDELVVMTKGQVTFKMWDVTTCAPENGTKENFKRIFGCARRTPETGGIDWDCLLRD